MKTELFAKNLKKEIKKQGYKLTQFAPDYLDMTIATFTNKCHKGTFTVNDILIVEGVLGIKFADLISVGKITAKPIKIVKREMKPVVIDMTKDFASGKIKSKIDVLKGI
tara:strand:+ start:325 stop:651 length:327 start_codon:yes stop_codon:yes gene_type:complete